MLKIRLRRQGRKHQPYYRIVVVEHTAPVQGQYLVNIGHYDPKKKQLVVNKELACEWMNKGAKPSNTVAKLFSKDNIKHKLIVIKKFKTKSKTQIEAEKKEKEAEKAKEAQEKELQKAKFEQEVKDEKAQAEIEKKEEETREKTKEETEEKTDTVKPESDKKDKDKE